jgi:hypothetical protein
MTSPSPRDDGPVPSLNADDQAAAPGAIADPDDLAMPSVRSNDDTDIGWGEIPDPVDGDHLREDRPPHWDE